jgi:Tol biopolymer transport system component
MGEVYRARDTKLNRDVALKVLPDALASDPDRVARFRREAQALASLNHPNIVTIHSVEEADTHVFLTMELVSGRSLADVLPGNGFTLDELLRIAIPLVDAIAAAHSKGITHRDLKPANIMLGVGEHDGRVKILDFGLARLAQAALEPAGPAASPTMTLTGEGRILGTAAYMSPEQAEGKPVDARSDLFSLGVMLYEMATGRRPFTGDTNLSIVSSIIKDTPPPVTELNPALPRDLARLIRRALSKNPGQRYQTAIDLRSDLEDLKELQQASSSAGRRRSRAAAIGAATAVPVLAAGIWAVLFVLTGRQTPTAPEMRVEINPPAQSLPLEFSLSPDGRHIVFVASVDGRRRLWLRTLNKMDAQAMTGTDGAMYPFWSADSRSIGYFASRKLYRIDVGGGSPQELADIPVSRGGTWNADGTIVFGPTDDGPLMRIARPGGEPRAVTHLDPGQTGHRWPQFLPDGRHFLFLADGTTSASGIYLGSLDGGAAKRLMASAVAAAYLEPNLVFVQQGRLVARHLDVVRGELTGDSMTLADVVGYDVGFKLGAFSVSADGHVAYQTRILKRDELFWADRTGATSRVAVNAPDVNRLVYPDLSPNGRTVAVQLNSQNNYDIWLIDLAGRGGSTRFTFDAEIDGYPRWSPDGSQILFTSARLGSPKLYLKASNGAPGSERLLLEKAPAFPEDWSRDGRFLLYMVYDPKTGRDLWAVDMNEKPLTPRPFVNTSFDERNGQFSPDGHWLAYQTDESGRPEVVVVSFPDPTERWNVSTSGGAQPRWRSDGKELYFVASDGRLMAAPITIARQAHGSRFEVGAPVSLFQTLMVGGGDANVNTQYAVSRDGRFLISQREESATTPITLILNWKPPASEITR